MGPLRRGVAARRGGPGMDVLFLAVRSVFSLALSFGLAATPSVPSKYLPPLAGDFRLLNVLADMLQPATSPSQKALLKRFQETLEEAAYGPPRADIPR